MTRKELREFGKYCAKQAFKEFCGNNELESTMTSFQVAKRLGVKPRTVVNCYKKWGLKVVGHGPNGLNIFSGPSLQKYIEGLSKDNE